MLSLVQVGQRSYDLFTDPNGTCYEMEGITYSQVYVNPLGTTWIFTLANGKQLSLVIMLLKST